jgi:hypothetical protein
MEADMSQSSYATNAKLLKSWKTGFADPNKEPCLVVDLHDGSHLTIMMPAQTAIDMGNGLILEGKRTHVQSKRTLN